MMMIAHSVIVGLTMMPNMCISGMKCNDTSRIGRLNGGGPSVPRVQVRVGGAGGGMVQGGGGMVSWRWRILRILTCVMHVIIYTGISGSY